MEERSSMNPMLSLRMPFNSDLFLAFARRNALLNDMMTRFPEVKILRKNDLPSSFDLSLSVMRLDSASSMFFGVLILYPRAMRIAAECYPYTLSLTFFTMRVIDKATKVHYCSNKALVKYSKCL